MKNEAEKLKIYDKLYFKFLKKAPENVAESMMNIIYKSGISGTFLYAIINDDLSTIKLLNETVKGINFFEDDLKQKITLLMMASLDNPEILPVMIELRDRICPLAKEEEFNEEMISCLYRHSFKYPQNKEICISTFKKYRCFKNTILKPYLYCIDSSELIENYLIKDNDIKETIMNCCITCGSTKILKRVLKFYKSSNIIYAKFDPVTIYNNIKDFDIRDEDVKFYLLNDVCINAKWDFLPSLFEEKRINEKDFVHFRFTLYQGLLNIQFVKTLIYYMKKYNFDLELLRDTKAEFIRCSKQVKDELIENGVLKGVNFEIGDFNDKFCDDFIASFFEAYNNDNMNLVKEKMIQNNANYNPRFIKELDYAYNLVSDKKMGWTEEMNENFLNFYDICKEFCRQLEIMNDVVLKYNVFVTIYNFFNDLVSLRHLNKIRKIAYSIKDTIIMGTYTVVYKNITEMYVNNLIKAKKFLGLNPTEKWSLPENPTLEELFIDLYLNSEYQNSEDDNLIYYIRQILEKKKFVKILEEVQAAVTYNVPTSEILRILRLKKIL
jgi:hypothetical protein